MTDLEICKLVAKIEDHITIVHNGFVFCPNVKVNYNPLTDDALCFQLMIKYGIRLSKNGDGKYVAMWSHCRGEESENPNKAICLAIIESSK